MILNGKSLTMEILARTKARAKKLPHEPRVVAISNNETAATKSYLKIKERAASEAGCALLAHQFPEGTIAPMLVRAVHTSAHGADALIVQLPLAKGINQQEICDAIPLSLDADVLSSAARMKFEADEPDALMSPVAGAVAEILKSAGIEAKGKRAVVVGNGWLVGKPCATLLSQLGADVAHLTLESGHAGMLKEADIIVSGAGAPHFIKPEMIKEGCVLIDAGTSESSGKVVGDADPACAARCSLFTPVPGGVGPVAVAKLFENAVILAERKVSF